MTGLGVLRETSESNSSEVNQKGNHHSFLGVPPFRDKPEGGFATIWNIPLAEVPTIFIWKVFRLIRGPGMTHSSQ